MALNQRSSGPEVSLLQRQLLTLNYHVSINGSYDTATFNAVEAFQKANGLTIDGVAGEQQTFPAIDALVPMGADISHQDSVIWSDVSRRIQFVIIKSSQGGTFVDPALRENISGAKSIGAIIGLYMFVDPNTPAKTQVANYLKSCASCNIKFGTAGILPPIIDVETDGITVALVQEIIALLRATGQDVIMYSYLAFEKDELKGEVFEVDIWQAAYQTAQPTIPIGYGKPIIWQWSQYIYAPGFSSNNEDIFIGNMKLLKTYANIK